MLHHTSRYSVVVHSNAVHHETKKDPVKNMRNVAHHSTNSMFHFYLIPCTWQKNDGSRHQEYTLPENTNADSFENLSHGHVCASDEP